MTSSYTTHFAIFAINTDFICLKAKTNFTFCIFNIHLYFHDDITALTITTSLNMIYPILFKAWSFFGKKKRKKMNFANVF